MPHGGFGGPDHRLRAGMVLTVDPSLPSSVVRRAVCSLVMELLCSLPSGDKEEERHKRGGGGGGMEGRKLAAAGI